VWRALLPVCCLILCACQKEQKGAPAASGEELYRTACRRCHGDDGRGGPPIGGHSPKNLRDPGFQSAWGDDRIKQAIRDGNDKGMPPFRAVFTEDELTALVAHVRTFAAH
jgi:mono/diheme cytochrome c family protein